MRDGGETAAVKIQNTEWGYIEWQQTHEESSEKQSMNIGISVMLPGKKQCRHIHHGQEQLLYVLNGEGIHIINGKEHPFHQGMMFYLEAGASHACINTGSVPVRELLVSNPIHYQPLVPQEPLSGSKMGQRGNLYGAVEAIRGRLLDMLDIPFTVFDKANWKVVYQNPAFPPYCVEKCNPALHSDGCYCMGERSFASSPQTECDQFVCPYGITVYHLPVVFNEKTIAVIRGGYILLSEDGGSPREGMYDCPQSTAIGIRRLLRQVSKSIINYCEFDAARQELANKEATLIRSAVRNKELEQTLKIAQNHVTNLKINHHFLFNTLNSMANMALVSGADGLYDAILDLANMFRYTMKTDQELVPLEQEIQYLENYLNLQRLRYGNLLVAEMDIEPVLLHMQVPFNFLQPVVENAFTHGFPDRQCPCYIKIAARKERERAILSVYNNGPFESQIALNRVRQGLASNSGHGLSLIYTKLRALYGEDFTMEIRSDCKRETCVVITLPLGEKKEELF